MLRGIDAAETRANLDAMLAELKRRDIPVLLTGMVAAPNLGADYAKAFDPIYSELATQYGASLYPFILDNVVTDPSLMLDDHIHPNAKGVGVIVQGLAPLVEEALPEGESWGGVKPSRSFCACRSTVLLLVTPKRKNG